MSAQAIAKGVRLSPRKVAAVAALVRGQSVSNAVTILQHVPRRPATAVRKVIESASANAENNHNYKPDSLQIKEISVTAGPRLKRFRPAAFGRVSPYQKKTSHIRVVVDGDKRVAKPAAAKKQAVAKVVTEEENK